MVGHEAPVRGGLGCCFWFCSRAKLSGNEQSSQWPDAKVEEVSDFPRTAMLIMAAYEEDLANPTPDFPPEAQELLSRVKLVKKTSYEETKDRCPPYVIALDHQAKDITVAVRGLNLGKVNEFVTLLDNRKGKQKFHDGFVHHGMLRSAGFLLDDEMDNLNQLMLQHRDYTLTLAGHSLGSGVVCLMALVLLENLSMLPGITRDRLRCHCFAPARCLSLNLAVSSADVVNSIILQDDFLPRMNYPLETMFGFYFCLPCVLQWACCVDFFLPPDKLVKDPRRLYPPGRLYHIVYTDGGKCTVVETPPEPRVAVPVDGRFEKLIISRTTHADHLLTTIYAKLGKMMDAMKEKELEWQEAPVSEKIARMATMRRDRFTDLVCALERAKEIDVPNAFDPEMAQMEQEEAADEAAGDEEKWKEREDLQKVEAAVEAQAPVLEAPRLERPMERGGGGVLGKWSKIIDDAIATENKKGGDSAGAGGHGGGGSSDTSASAGPGKMGRKWSMVRRAVKEGKVAENEGKGTAGAQGTGTQGTGGPAGTGAQGTGGPAGTGAQGTGPEGVVERKDGERGPPSMDKEGDGKREGAADVKESGAGAKTGQEGGFVGIVEAAMAETPVEVPLAPRHSPRALEIAVPEGKVEKANT